MGFSLQHRRDFGTYIYIRVRALMSFTTASNRLLKLRSYSPTGMTKIISHHPRGGLQEWIENESEDFEKILMKTFIIQNVHMKYKI